MPWQPFAAVMLIGLCASSTCCAEQSRYASHASGGLHRSDVNSFSAAAVDYTNFSKFMVGQVTQKSFAKKQKESHMDVGQHCALYMRLPDLPWTSKAEITNYSSG